jgi:hypothetical protein
MRHVLVPVFAMALLAPAHAVAQSQSNPTMPAPGETQPRAQELPPSQHPEQQRGVEEYLRSKSGQDGKQEPSASANDKAVEDRADAVFVNGALNVPGAPKDTQTVPAKFSARNDAIDKTPIVAMPIGLSDVQKMRILQTVRAANAPIQKVDAKVTSPLPSNIPLFDLPANVKAEIPNLKDIKFVRLDDRVLMVYAPNWIVVGEIKN